MDGVDINTKPQDLNILLIHGTLDSVVPVQASQKTKEFLEAVGFNPQLRLIPGLDHPIDTQGFKGGGEFLGEDRSQT